MATSLGGGIRLYLRPWVEKCQITRTASGNSAATAGFFSRATSGSSERRAETDGASLAGAAISVSMPTLTVVAEAVPTMHRHCEARSAEAIQPFLGLDCF